jgi:hypothetical protein
MKCYLAHPVTDYGGTERQLSAIRAIQERGWTVENPDSPIHQDAYRQHGMGHFLEVAERCHVLAFLRFSDGCIGAGVGKEIERALHCCLPIFDASNGALKRVSLRPGPILSVDQTRTRIAEARAAKLREEDLSPRQRALAGDRISRPPYFDRQI